MLALLALIMAQEAAPVYKSPGVQGFNGDLPLKYEAPLATQVSLTLAPAKQYYEQGEAIDLAVIATNLSDESVLCHCVLALGSIIIEYRRAEDEFRVLNLGYSYPEVLPLYQLAPGEAVRHVTRISFDPTSGELVLRAPGRYEFRVTYFDRESKSPESRVVSKPVAIDIAPASNPEAFEAYKGDLALLVHRNGGGVPHDSLLRKAAQFLSRFDSSVYAADVRRAFGGMLRWRIYDEQGNLRSDATDEHRALYESFGQPRGGQEPKLR